MDAKQKFLPKDKSKALFELKEILYSHLLTTQEMICRPIDAKGFTEICKQEGEKRALKQELEFLRDLLDMIERS